MKESSTEWKNVREEEKWVKSSGWEDEEGRGGKEWKEEKEDFPWTYFLNIQTSELRTHKKKLHHVFYFHVVSAVFILIRQTDQNNSDG